MSYRILVVDDSTTIQKIFKIALSRHDAEMVAATTYLEALNEIARGRPSLLVVDANLPGVRGPAELQKLQSETGGVPVLLLIGSHEPFDESAFAAAGYPHYLKKPFEAQDIIRAVTLVLGEEIPLRARSEHTRTNLEMPAAYDSGDGTASGVTRVSQRPPIQTGGLSTGEGISGLPPLPNQGRPSISIPLPGETDNDLLMPPPPPLRRKGSEDTGAGKSIPFEFDEARRGRRAFQQEEQTTGLGFSTPEDDMPETVVANFNAPQESPWNGIPAPRPSEFATTRVTQNNPPASEDQFTQDLHEIKNKLEEFIRGEAPIVVRKAVEKYCELHFSQLAKDVLVAELRRLAEEKSRLLSD